jgi:hypothetical protein
MTCLHQSLSKLESTIPEWFGPVGRTSDKRSFPMISPIHTGAIATLIARLPRLKAQETERWLCSDDDNGDGFLLPRTLFESDVPGLVRNGCLFAQVRFSRLSATRQEINTGRIPVKVSSHAAVRGKKEGCRWSVVVNEQGTGHDRRKGIAVAEQTSSTTLLSPLHSNTMPVDLEI